MPRNKTQAAKKKNPENFRRSVESDVFTDSEARNRLASQPKKTAKSKVHKQSHLEVKKEQRSVRLYGKKKPLREYTEKELHIPVLNRAIVPGVVPKARGKKGKKFVDDHDSVVLTRLVKQINDKKDLLNESKLEKSQRIEEIRELKKQEIEKKEELKKQKLDDKKQQIKSKANTARAIRRRNARELARKAKENADEKLTTRNIKKPIKSVSFA